MVIANVEDAKISKQIPEGRPKSGRTWKVKQTVRASFLSKTGILSHMRKSFEEKEQLREKRDRLLAKERAMVEEKKQNKRGERERREERQKQRMANEYKNSMYQELKPEKLKGMSKKQLRMVRKTAMNKNGQVELVNPFGK